MEAGFNDLAQKYEWDAKVAPWILSKDGLGETYIDDFISNSIYQVVKKYDRKAQCGHILPNRIHPTLHVQSSSVQYSRA